MPYNWQKNIGSQIRRAQTLADEIFTLARAKVTDTFSMAGSSTAISGTKMDLALNVGGDLVNVRASVPLRGNSRDIVSNLKLDAHDEHCVDRFYKTELLCAVIERKPAKCPVTIIPNMTNPKLDIQISVPTLGFTHTINGTISARDSVLLIRSLTDGAGYVVPEHWFNALVGKLSIEDAEALTDDIAAIRAA